MPIQIFKSKIYHIGTYYFSNIFYVIVRAQYYRISYLYWFYLYFMCDT